MRVHLLLGLFILSLPLGSSLALSAEEGQEIKAHAALLHTIAVAPDGKTVATGGFDKMIVLWEFNEGKLKELRKLPGHTDSIYSLAFDPEGKKLASGSQDKSIRIWNVADGKQLAELKGHTDLVGCVEFSTDGKLLASGGGSQDKSVRLWDLKENKELKNLGTHAGSVYALSFSPDGKRLASSGADGAIKIWDLDKKKEIEQIKRHDLGVTGLVFTGPDTLISIGQDRWIQVWNLRGHRLWVMDNELVRKLGPSQDDLYGLAWHKPTQMLATIGYSGLIAIWNPNDAKPKFTRKVKSPGYCIAFVGGGKYVLTGHDNGNVVVTPLGR